MRIDKYYRPIMLMFFCTFLIAAGQIIWKFSTINSSDTFFRIILILIGFLFYGAGGVIMIIALKSGQLSVLHPIFSLGYVWVSIASPFLFATEIMTANKWVAVALFFGGITLISYGGKK